MALVESDLDRFSASQAAAITWCVAVLLRHVRKRKNGVCLHVWSAKAEYEDITGCESIALPRWY